MVDPEQQMLHIRILQALPTPEVHRKTEIHEARVTTFRCVSGESNPTGSRNQLTELNEEMRN